MAVCGTEEITEDTLKMGTSRPETGEVPSVSRTVMMPDPRKRDLKDKRVSIASTASSIFSDVSLENGESTRLNTSQKKKTKLQRRRKRLSTLLHTHVVLILVCSLSALDAICVMGQIICDVLLMKESLEHWEDLDGNLTRLLWKELPTVLNTSEHRSPDDLDLYKIADILWAKQHDDFRFVDRRPMARALLSRKQPSVSGGDDVIGDEGDTSWLPETSSTTTTTTTTTSSSAADPNTGAEEMLQMLLKLPPSSPVGYSRRKRAASATERDEEAELLYNLTHYFHLGSMIILSALLLECLLKVFAMGKKILHHKLEMFDVFVVAVSWALDVAFWEGIWAHPETEAAMILIVMLPWRIIRIINSFVLVIQEKDHVELKIVKQRLRLSVKNGKEVVKKASSYKTEARQLQALSRRYGATDAEITSCIPADRQRRRSLGNLLKPATPRRDSTYSLSVSTLNAFASLDMPDSSSDEDDLNTSRDRTYESRQEPKVRSGLSVSTLEEEVFASSRRESESSVENGGVPVDNGGFQGDSNTKEDNNEGTTTRKGSITRL
ncbi:uncharacterized protein LOC143301429 [Babylonia areolata]|uniref:uncharacterized protein LOC143301429 n=1 Tax=Babylonia areolata TaxID=304850 RepID=UPI003FCFFEAD